MFEKTDEQTKQIINNRKQEAYEEWKEHLFWKIEYVRKVYG